MPNGASPSDNSAPIMAREQKAFVPKLPRNVEHIGCEPCHFIGPPILWLAAFVITTLVGNDDAKTSLGERLNLAAPAVPEFRIAMEKNSEGAILRACRNGVDRHIGQPE